eukprot:TRINITY_DN24655_c0_g1_i1.p1 TRINITY_DN24655_c0_g1~~TRINITY_DN24655_c0_g1_i1.p1  ORF type:complete len:612 (+),score=204.42 TRINITY_DN24655_c0_g1_i1:33-1838(+)
MASARQSPRSSPRASPARRRDPDDDVEEDEDLEFDPLNATSTDAGQLKLTPLSTTLWRLLALARPELPSLLASAGLLGLYNRVTLTVPRQLGQLVDISEKGSRSEFRSQCSKLVAMFCLGGVANFVRLYLAGTASERIVLGVRTRLFSTLIKKPMEFHDAESNTASELVHRLQHDSDKVGKMITDTFLHVCKSVVQTVGSLALLFDTSPRLALCMAMLVPPAAISSACYGRFAKKFEQRGADKLAANATAAEAFLSNIRVVKAFSEEKVASSHYCESLAETYEAKRAGIVASASYTAFLQTSGYLVILAMLGIGGVEVSGGKLTVGQLTSLMLYTVYTGVGIAGCGSSIVDVLRCIGMSRRLFALYQEAEAAAPARHIPINETHMLPPNSIGGEIAFKNVSFAYPSRPGVSVWRDVSFTIPSGSCCAVVGHSGSGKSTLVNLLLKLYRQDAGSISLEGVNIDKIPDEALRSLVTYVPQDPLLFAGSVFENIMFGVPVPAGADPREIAVSAAKRAQAHEFISSLDKGYDTYVGDKGSQISGGQRQRVAIARALAKELCGCSRILVLDEATSGLDPVTRVCDMLGLADLLWECRKGKREHPAT